LRRRHPVQNVLITIDITYYHNILMMISDVFRFVLFCTRFILLTFK